MKNNYYRTSEGKFKRKSKWKVLRNWIILIIIVWLGVTIALDSSKSLKTAPESVVSTKDEGLTAEQKQFLEKQAELAKQEQILLNKKAALESQIKDIENQLGEVRSQKTSFK